MSPCELGQAIGLSDKTRSSLQEWETRGDRATCALYGWNDLPLTLITAKLLDTKATPGPSLKDEALRTRHIEPRARIAWQLIPLLRAMYSFR